MYDFYLYRTVLTGAATIRLVRNVSKTLIVECLVFYTQKYFNGMSRPLVSHSALHVAILRNSYTLKT